MLRVVEIGRAGDNGVADGGTRYDSAVSFILRRIMEEISGD
jgi:hypothetical protein